MTATSRKRSGRSASEPLLCDCVKKSLTRYFECLNGHQPGALYELVVSEVEQPLLEVVMEQSDGNLTVAASLLGINRATLRRKLQKYGLHESQQ